jgi:type I restriction enzyme, S subunit
MPKQYRSRLGPLPEDALDEEVLFDPAPKISPAMREWLAELGESKPVEKAAEEGSRSEVSDQIRIRKGLWDLPDGWEWAGASNFAAVVGGGTPRDAGDAANYADDGTPWITPADLSGYTRTHIERGPRNLSQLGYVNSSARLLPMGAVLFSSRAPVGYCVVASNPVCTNQGFKSLVLGEGIIPEYIRYYVIFNKKYFVNNASGTTFRELSGSVLRELLFPLAPLPEQRRIVARIDELFAEIAEGEAALERVRQGLDTWRRALLKAAVTGELTRDWRDANRPAETGADLLVRIRTQREASNTGRSRRRRASAAEPLDTAGVPELPDSWGWARLGDLGAVVGGVTVDKKREPSDPVDMPYLRVANVQRGYLDLAEVKSIRVDREVARRLELKAGDILLNEGGDRDKIGRGWVWQDELQVCIHQNHVFRVRLYDDGINAFLISHYANEIGRAFFIEKGKQTTNLASISLSKINELPIPVPPAAEAQIIIERLREALDSDADNRRDMADAEALSSTVRQSILKAGFEGRLVPQDPADEPASALLARLRNDHPGNGARRRRARAAADFSHPSLPGLPRPFEDPRVEPAGE